MEMFKNHRGVYLLTNPGSRKTANGIIMENFMDHIVTAARMTGATTTAIYFVTTLVDTVFSILLLKLNKHDGIGILMKLLYYKFRSDRKYLPLKSK